MHWTRPFCWGLFLSLCLGSTEGFGQLVLKADDPAAVLQNGAGSARFTITNSDSKPASLTLKPGIATDETSHARLTAAKIALHMEAGGEAVAQTMQIDPNATLAFTADITGLTAASATFPIFNGNARLPVTVAEPPGAAKYDPDDELRVVTGDSPLGISIDGDGSADKPLAFTPGNQAIITLKNGDTASYPLQWSFRFRGMTSNDKLSIPANGRATLALTPNKDAFISSDFIRPSTQTGQLLLWLDPGTPAGKIEKTVHPLAVTIKVQRMGVIGATLSSDVYVGIFLLAGGFLSVLANGLLPNILRKAALRDQIHDLASRTTSVSTRVDSYLRVLLRLERKKMDILLKSIGRIGLISGEGLDEVADDIGRLTKRVTVAEGLDDLRRRLEVAMASAPPSVIQDVDAKLQAAADQMHSLSLPDENVTAANGFLADAEKSLNAANDPNAMAQQIAARFKDLKTRIANFTPPYSDIKTALGGVFGIMDLPFDDPTRITPEMAYAIDHNIAAIHTALDYAVVRVSLPSAGSADCPTPDATSAKKLSAHECDLIDLLGTMSWQGLKEAGTLVQQMREGVYEQDILDQIANKDRVRVDFDTQKARPYLPVFFSIAFTDPRYNSAAAIENLDCEWTFPGGLTEPGWKVCHYFLGTEGVAPEQPAAAPFWKIWKRQAPAARKVSIPVTVQRQRIRGSTDSAGDSGKQTIQREIEVQPSVQPRERSRRVAGVLRFSIAFGAALAALLSGAADQLQKLDLVPATFAIVALGFGADAVKNLLTQTPKKTAS